jgi:hypothetical protein
MTDAYTSHLAMMTGQPWPFGIHGILASTVADIEGRIEVFPGPYHLTAFDALLLACPPRNDLEPQLTQDMLANGARSILNALSEADRLMIRTAIDTVTDADDGHSIGSFAITIRNAVMHAEQLSPTTSEDDPVWAAARYAPVPVQWLAALIDAYHRATSTA